MKQSEIEAFLAIIEYGSIKAAAEKMFVGQPTLSARIVSLEEELNTELFKRKRGQRNTELTIQGKKFEPFARKWMTLLEDAKDAVKDDSYKVINWGSCHSVNAYIMPEIYQSLMARTEEVSFRLWTYHYNEVFKMVESGEIEFGFVSKLQYSKIAKVYPIFSEEMVLLYDKHSNYGQMVHPKSLDIRREVYIEWDDNYCKWHKYWLGSSQQTMLQTSDVTSAKNFIRTGEYWAIVPITIAQEICINEEFAFSYLEDNPVLRTTYLICREEIETYQFMKEIIQLMESVVEKLGGKWLFNEDDAILSE